MIDFDQREAQFARLRESLVALDGAASGEVASEDDHDATQTSQGSTTQAAANAASAVKRPLVAYDPSPIRSAYRLQYGFVIDGQRVESLFFTEPSFADVEDRVHGRITEQELHARMAGVDVEVLRALKWCDSRVATLLARTVAPDLGDV